MLEIKVAAFLERHSFSLEDKRIVVGVSGGPDSLALLHYLWREREKQHFSLTVATVDHMFRGEESLQEALFVKDYCRQHSISFRMAQVNVPDMMLKTGKSAEAAGREARYGFFARVMEETASSLLALAHHGDDQIETILMRFTRGSTGEARAGIPFKRPFQDGLIFRPFLSLTKEEIMQYCHEQQLAPRLDPSNSESIYTRNRFRKIVLPFLKSENQQVHEHFQRFSEETRSDETYLQELTVQSMNKVMEMKGEQKITIDIGGFLKMPMPLQRRGIQLILNYLYKERPASLSAVHIDQLFSLIKRPQPSGKLYFPNELKVIRSYQKCHFQFALFNPQSFQLELAIPGVTYLPSGGIIMTEYTKAPILTSDVRIAFFAADTVKMPLLVRSRKAGDRMTLKGMPGTKKIKDIFIDQKISIQERDEWPIVTDQEGCILWLLCLKKSAMEGINNKTGHYLQLTYKRIDF